MSNWVGYEERGGLDGDCAGCGIVSRLASSATSIVYYAYFIGFQANLMGGFGDCNVDTDDETLCTRGAQWIREHRNSIIDMYANYARMVHETSPGKQVIWWLERDFIQYSYDDPLRSAGDALGRIGPDVSLARRLRVFAGILAWTSESSSSTGGVPTSRNGAPSGRCRRIGRPDDLEPPETAEPSPCRR